MPIQNSSKCADFLESVVPPALLPSHTHFFPAAVKTQEQTQHGFIKNTSCHRSADAASPPRVLLTLRGSHLSPAQQALVQKITLQQNHYATRVEVACSTSCGPTLANSQTINHVPPKTNLSKQTEIGESHTLEHFCAHLDGIEMLVRFSNTLKSLI